jgi:hypothetical protein
LFTVPQQQPAAWSRSRQAKNGFASTTIIPTSWAALTQLTYLNMSSNSYSPVVGGLAAGITALSALRVLDFSFNNLQVTRSIPSAAFV